MLGAHHVERLGPDRLIVGAAGEVVGHARPNDNSGRYLAV
jgi:hypothetical protein